MELGQKAWDGITVKIPVHKKKIERVELGGRTGADYTFPKKWAGNLPGFTFRESLVAGIVQDSWERGSLWRGSE